MSSRTLRSLTMVLVPLIVAMAPSTARAGDDIFLDGFESESVELWSADVGYPCPVFRNVATTSATIAGSAPSRYILFSAWDGAKPVETALFLELYEDFDAPMSPEEVNLDLDGNDNYATCGTCVLYYYHFDGESPPEKILYQRNGTVNITTLDPQVGGSYAATIDAKLEEVTIDGDFVSTPVPGGCVAPIHLFAFSETLIDAP